jgi:ABC-type multidrug transport system fused ATPase/permease subunit
MARAHSKMMRICTGLLAEPNRIWYTRDSMSPTFKRYLKYTRPYRWLILGAIVAGVLKFTLALFLPGTFGYIIDSALLTELSPHDKLLRILTVLAILAGVLVLRIPMTYLRSYWCELASMRTIFDIRSELFGHVQRLSLAYHSRRRTGTTISRLINDLNTTQEILDRGIVSLCMDGIFLTGVVVFLHYLDWKLALASLFTLPFYGILFKAINPKLRNAALQVQADMEEMSGEATEKIAGLPVVMAYGRERTEQLNFFRRHRKYHTNVLSRVKLQMHLESVAEFLTSFGPLVVILYGGYRCITETGDPSIVAPLTVGKLVAFYGYLNHLYLPTRRLADYSAQLQIKLASLDRVFDVLDQKPDIADASDAAPIASPKGRIEFKNVRFAYKPERPVLKGVTFKIEPGQAVAVVGRSGAGKSTLASLVSRFYDVNDGAVLVDGQDVRTLTLTSLRENVGMVLQDTILFSGSIRENILYGRHGATEDEMLAAARMAHVTEFVEAMPAGFDTIIGERGVTLSGGQKQRLSIARAFLRDPRILILDEATSNLDSGAEQIIQDALRNLMKGRTTLVIAHRLSTIVDCDFVVVLDGGVVAQQGTHYELIRQQGPYRQFCREQFGDVELENLSRRAV